MTCSDFLARYSEFFDGVIPPDDRASFRSHLEECGSCERYHRVVRRGVTLLRSLPPQPLRDDFRDRLRHSLYTIEEEQRIRRQRPSAASGGGAMAVVAATLLVVAVLWTPSLWEATPSVTLPAVIASPPSVATGVTLLPGALYERPAPRQTPAYQADLWTGSHTLLFEHSPLYQRYRGPGLIRTGFD